MDASPCPNANILLTNDDGITSPGLQLLYEAVSSIGEVEIIAPKNPRSACGHGMTLHNDIKGAWITIWNNVRALAIDGLPADAVYIALRNKRPDIVLSGINLGDNTSLQSILASSTIGAVVHAALNDIPGIAFSIEIRDKNEFYKLNSGYLAFIKEFIRKLTESILCNNLLRPVSVLSVNFPRRLSSKEILLAKPAKLRFKQYAKLVKKDNDIAYYRLVGVPIKPPLNSDTDLLLRGHIVITPLCPQYIGLCPEETWHQLAKTLNNIIGTSKDLI